MPPVRRLAAAAFWPLLLAWTWLLVRPNPVPELQAAVPGEWRFAAAKTLHVGGYATLAALGCVWPGSVRGRAVVLAGLLLHGVGTEVVQTFVPNRSGKVSDVLIDWAGIAVGTGAVWAVWKPRLLPGPDIPAEPAG